MKVRKAIIPAAGLGTRFLPATKAQPKEMLPLVDKPTIQYVVEEAVASGIKDIIIVTGRGKRAIEDHFDRSIELETFLEEKGKLDLLKEVRSISDMVDVHYVRQKEAKGLGHAVWCARRFIGNEPFAVMLGDDIVVGEPPCLAQLLEVYYQTGEPVVGVQPVPLADTKKYGIVDVEHSDGRCLPVRDLVEKPAPEQAPSRLAIMGRYVLTPDIFPILEAQETGVGGEIQLTDALRKLNQKRRIHACIFTGKRYDVGDKLGYIQATVELALRREDLREQVEKYLEELVEKKKVLL
ncbi:UTP--glucose-1-phosphate uridylyltransferase GalU [Carboxydocella sp. ULO1]|uniref:UTP--glucose-1-phosphate uridylyltransferase GalU n=1 Tax=Carboxydocella sp. ULO1 TaxID=1926599 RepID=UPI0009AED7CE|nr:UTP--glucose-1-phosphate uridylyltransferase GalU [Carboxydocella sp. ULO1]GAW28001.1 UTP--glucose-1-phosphate uridylyltransferase [Carboxydocella sp. ULO1]